MNLFLSSFAAGLVVYVLCLNTGSSHRSRTLAKLSSYYERVPSSVLPFIRSEHSAGVELIMLLDRNRDGYLSAGELGSFMQGVTDRYDVSVESRQLFDRFVTHMIAMQMRNLDSDGKLDSFSRQELETIRLDDLVSFVTFDADGNGKIDAPELDALHNAFTTTMQMVMQSEMEETRQLANATRLAVELVDQDGDPSSLSEAEFGKVRRAVSNAMQR